MPILFEGIKKTKTKTKIQRKKLFPGLHSVSFTSIKKKKKDCIAKDEGSMSKRKMKYIKRKAVRV